MLGSLAEFWAVSFREVRAEEPHPFGFLLGGKES